MRRETDALGDLLLTENAYYGIQTERARKNFDISGQTYERFPDFIWCIAAIKKAAALANARTGALDKEIADAIGQAADEIMSGKMKDQFPIDIFQGGGGTSINMNVNEVIANRANELLMGEKGYSRVHPNTHVNMCQSTNDVIPSAIKMTCHIYLKKLIKSIDVLEQALRIKTDEFKDVVKLGRTCLQDAVPITLGQEFSGYLGFIMRQKQTLENLMDTCLDIPLGATAIGTGIGTVPGYVENVYMFLSDITGIPVRKEKNYFDALQNGDFYIYVSTGLKALATGLSKMATDFRLLSSGPRAGINEINLPAVQPGSSIMPGKVNPVMPELVNQVCYQVCGNDLAVTMAVEGGELDLNVWEPVIAKCLFESFMLLANSILLFSEKCVMGITANKERCRTYAVSSLALSTVIAARAGYKTGSRVAEYASERNLSIKEAAVEMNILAAEEAEKLFDPMLLTDSEKSGKEIPKDIHGIPERSGNS